MQMIMKLPTAAWITIAISCLRFAADAFTSQLRLHQCSVPTTHNQLAGKKRKGSFLDEFSDDGPTTKSTPTTKANLRSSQDNVHTDMIEWLKQHPLTYINPKFKILPSELGGYGGFCAQTPENKLMQQNEMIMCIPRELCITFEDALNDPKCGGAFRLIREYQLPDWRLLLVAGWAAKEYLMANLLEDKKSEIKHLPYLKSIPWKRGELDQEHVLFWTEDEVETSLGGSLAYDDAQLVRSRVQNATKLLDDRAIGPFFREIGLEPAQYTDGLKEAVAAAFASALSRSFSEEVEVEMLDGSVEIEKETLMIPLLDILQHSNEPNTLVETYDDYIILKAKRTILPGEEIYHRYQEEDDDVIPPYKFFTRYGFVPNVKTPVVELLKEKSPLFFDESSYSQFYGS